MDRGFNTNLDIIDYLLFLVQDLKQEFENLPETPQEYKKKNYEIQEKKKLIKEVCNKI